MKKVFLAASLLLASCNTVKKIRFEPPEAFDENEVSEDLRIEFNGVASFYIQYRGNAVLTDPFLSNPGLTKVLFGKLVSDTALINRLQPKTAHLKLIVIGHAHYDHILDLPYFVNKADSGAVIAGSANAVLMAQALGMKLSCVNMSERKATSEKSGMWLYAPDSSVRVMAVKSEHLPHILGKHLYKGHLDENNCSSFPSKSGGFLQDETLAYLIDFLDENGKPAKRIYFSSSAAVPPNGFLPPEIIREKTVDVAILSLAMAQKAGTYPAGLLKLLRPEHIIYCHWENFFRTREKPLKFVSMTRYKYIKEALSELDPAINQHFVKPGNSIVLR